MSYVSMSVDSGWWMLKILGTEIACSYIWEGFPFTFLEALAAWKRGEDRSLEFNGENVGFTLHIAPAAGELSRVVITEESNYNCGFDFSFDAEGEIVPKDETSTCEPDVPTETILLDQLLPSTALVADMIAAVDEAIRQAGSVRALLDNWYCLSVEELEATYGDANLPAADFEAELQTLR